jgi:predicted RNA methylase
MKIDSDVLDILKSSTVEDHTLYLPTVQLERNLYVKVNKCLENIGGNWNRKAKGHIFNDNPSDLLDEMINTGEVVDKKKEYQYFFTPKSIVKEMIELAEIKSTDILLEPEAGTGSILEEFPKENSYIAIELMPENCKILKNKGYFVLEGDFLKLSVDSQLSLHADKIIMNPPFSKQQDIDHVLNAWKCLNNNGTLVSIVSESPFFRENKKSQDFRKFLQEKNAKIIKLNDGAFRESGTLVNTRIVKIVK